MPFKIGSFNLLPSFTVMTLCIAGVGVLPYYVRILMTGEASTVKDDFESYNAFKTSVWDINAPYSHTNEFASHKRRVEVESEWRRWHAAVRPVGCIGTLLATLFWSACVQASDASAQKALA